MREHKILEEGIPRIPVDQRRSRPGNPISSRKPEPRLPLLWLARLHNELFFVNHSDETLDFVFASGGGFVTADEGVVAIHSKDQFEYQYYNVAPGTAVKIDEYDGYYDLDYVLQVTARVQSPKLGCIELTSPAEKGGVPESVLLWDSGEPGRRAYIRPCPDS